VTATVAETPITVLCARQRERSEGGRTPRSALATSSPSAPHSPAPLTLPPSKAEKPERSCDHLHAQRRAHQVLLWARVLRFLRGSADAVAWERLPLRWMRLSFGPSRRQP